MKQSMKAAMRNGESGMYTLRADGARYKIYLEPVGINGWYLFCVNTMKEVVFYLFLLGTDRKTLEKRPHDMMRRIKQAPLLERSSYYVLFYCGVTDTEGGDKAHSHFRQSVQTPVL